jgi:hypothetical protein
MRDRAPDLFDSTNHCTDVGNMFLADLLAKELAAPRREWLESRMEAP